MSRIGKKLIYVPKELKIELSEGVIIIKGAKGELKQKLNPAVLVKITEPPENAPQNTGSVVSLTVKNPQIKQERALWGLFHCLITNMICGLTRGFEKKLEINGIGFKASVSGNEIILNVGFSHSVNFKLPSGLSARVEKNILTISGADKKLIGDVAGQIRAIRKPEPYKGTGIKYVDEVVRRKAGKAVKTTA